VERDSAARIVALEAELASVRAEAEAERERFDRRLRLAQSALPERRDPRTVTQNIAAQQEIDALRGALRERDRVVKELTEQVRALEDQLEDHYRRFDELRRRLEQREVELQDVRRQAELASRRVDRSAPPPPRIRPAVHAPPPPPPPEKADAVAFGIGMLVGALLAVAAAVGLWWTGHLPPPPAFGAVMPAIELPAQIAAAAARSAHGG
jgi:TolA-binding protein